MSWLSGIAGLTAHLIHAVGWLFQQLLLALLRFYRYWVSPALGQHCRFEPSCSAYALEAIKKQGVLRGTWLSLHRLMRCCPGGGQGLDPVPLSSS